MRASVEWTSARSFHRPAMFSASDAMRSRESDYQVSADEPRNRGRRAAPALIELLDYCTLTVYTSNAPPVEVSGLVARWSEKNGHTALANPGVEDE
jgi:hypothetical protein